MGRARLAGRRSPGRDKGKAGPRSIIKGWQLEELPGSGSERGTGTKEAEEKEGLEGWRETGAAHPPLCFKFFSRLF